MANEVSRQTQITNAIRAGLARLSLTGTRITHYGAKVRGGNVHVYHNEVGTMVSVSKDDGATYREVVPW